MTMENYSNKLKNLVNIWVDMALTKNLSGKGTNKQIMTFNLYQNIDLIRFSIVKQAMLDGVINSEPIKGVEEQLQIVTEVVYKLKGDIFKKVLEVDE